MAAEYPFRNCYNYNGELLKKLHDFLEEYNANNNNGYIFSGNFFSAISDENDFIKGKISYDEIIKSPTITISISNRPEDYHLTNMIPNFDVNNADNVNELKHNFIDIFNEVEIIINEFNKEYNKKYVPLSPFKRWWRPSVKCEYTNDFNLTLHGNVIAELPVIKITKYPNYELDYECYLGQYDRSKLDSIRHKKNRNVTIVLAIITAVTAIILKAMS